MMQSNSTFDEPCLAALQTNDPFAAFSKLVHEWAARGTSKKDIETRLEQFVLRLRESDEHSDDNEEVVAGVLDALCGWCLASDRLLPD